TLQNRMWRRNVVKLQIGEKRYIVDLTFDAIVKHRLHLGCEDELVFIEQVQQRFYSEAIAGEEQCLFGLVVNTEREKSIQAVQAPGSVANVQLQQDFRIAV